MCVIDRNNIVHEITFFKVGWYFHRINEIPKGELAHVGLAVKFNLYIKKKNICGRFTFDVLPFLLFF